MTNVSYGYSISNDFTNNKVAEDRLTLEITSSAISKAISHIDTDSTTCFIWFKETLTAADQTILDGIVSLHSGLILDNNKPKEVLIKEENHETGGSFQTVSHVVDIQAATGWYESDISWPFPISLLTADYVGHPDIYMDEGQVIVGPDTIVGVLTADAAVGDTVFSVSQTVIDNGQIGRSYKLYGDDVGRCIALDTENNTITCETPCSMAHSAATTTYIQMSTFICPKMVFPHTGVISVADSKIGGSHIPANTPIRLRYNNLNGLAKRFFITFEYLY